MELYQLSTLHLLLTLEFVSDRAAGKEDAIFSLDLFFIFWNLVSCFLCSSEVNK